MAGQFVFKAYQVDDYQSYYYVKVQPETLTFEAAYYKNDPPGQNYDEYTYIKTRGSRRSRSPFAGSIRFKWLGSAPAGYVETGELQIPVLLAFQRSIFLVGVEGMYLGFPVKITKVIREHVP